MCGFEQEMNLVDPLWHHTCMSCNWFPTKVDCQFDYLLKYINACTDTGHQGNRYPAARNSASPPETFTLQLNTPGTVTILQGVIGIYCIEGLSELSSQSAEVRLAVSGGQPLFTLGLPMFALSLIAYPSLLPSPSTNIETFYFSQNYHLKDTHKILKNACRFKAWMVFVGQILIKLGTSSI